MSDDVLITPASRKVEFFDSGGNIDGKIELSTAGDLNITTPNGGKITIGDITQDIHIGDGTQAVDLVFDFTSSIYSVANQDLTIGKGSLGGNDVTIDGASAVLLSLAGTEQARLTSTGLGIGTTSPDAKLDIEQTDGAVHGLKVYRNDDSTSAALVYLHDDHAFNDNAVLHVKTDRTDQFGVAAIFEGRVGLGTSSPDATLDIKTGGSGSRTAFNSVADDLVVDSTGDTGITISSSNTATGNVFFADSDNDSRGQIRYDHAGNTMRFSVSGEEKVRIASDGDVGIGTTSPEARLEVVAALNPSSATQFSYAEVLKLDVENSGTAEGPAVRFRTGATNDHNAADYMFQVNGDGGGMSAHEYSFNWGYNKWYHVSGADGTKPIINLSYGGSSSAGQTQYGIINLVSTATAWDVYDGTHTGLSPTTYDNNVRINAGGDSYFNGGDVGINQSSPAALLHIKGSENSWDKHIRLENHDTTDYGAILVDNQGMKFRTFTNGHDFHFRDNDNNTLLQIQDGAGIKFNNAYEFPTSDGSANQVLQTDGNGTLSFATVSGGGGGVTLTGSTNDQLVTVTGSNAIQGESNLTLSSTGVLALTGNMTITDSHATTPTLLVEQNNTSNDALVAQFKVQDDEVLSIKNQGQLVFNLDQAGGEADEVIMLYRDTAGTERNFMSIDQGTIVIQNRGPSGDVEIRANTSTAGGSGETLMASFQTSGITFSNAYTFPTADGTVNSMLTTDGSGNVDFRNGTYLSKPAVFTDTGGHNITQTESTIPFDNEVLDPTNNASLATGLGEDGHIRLLAGGYYRISYSIPIEDDGTTAEADRTRVFCVMQTSSSSAFGSPTTVTQSRAQVYTRESSGGSGLATSFIYQHTANHYIRLRIDEQNNTNISIEDGQAQISIEYIGPA